MCEPVTVATTAVVAAEAAPALITAGEMIAIGVAAASAGVGYFAQQQAADDNRAAAEANYQAQMKQLQLQREQINEQASDEISFRAKTARSNLASLRVSAGESGIAGITEGNLEREVKFNESQDIATIQKNRRNAMDQTTAQGASLAAQNMSQVNSVRQPSLIGSALQVAQTGAYLAARRPTTSGIQTGGDGK